MPCLWVVFDREGEEGRSRRCAELEDGFAALGIEASAAAGHDSWVFNPDFEASVGADGCYEVGVYCGREPLNLYFPVRITIEKGKGGRGEALLGSQQHVQSTYRIKPNFRLDVDCRLLSSRLQSLMRSGRRSY